MRTIKFRGYNKKNSAWLYGSYILNRGAHFVAPDEFAEMIREANRNRVYEDGCEYGYQYAVEKACEWLSNFDAYRICLEGHKADFVELFRKAMEE